jgi:pyruvate/2-oxoglutarate/acetoin dehydrogenase E1 component
MQQLKPPKDLWFRNRLLRDAIGQAIYEEMKSDPAIHLFGEGAHMKVHFDAPKIEEEMLDRVHTLPISEDGNTNFAVGASLVGVKPVVDIILADFMYRSMDSIANTAAKLNFVQGSKRTMVVRAEFLIGGPTVGLRPEALFTHMPGINVVVPSTPMDAYGLMKTALHTEGVTVFFEDRVIKDSLIKEEDKVLVGPIPLGQARLRNVKTRPKLTIVTYGLGRQIVESALEQGNLKDVDVIDLRTLYPIGWIEIYDSLDWTGRLLIVEPDVTYGGIGAEIAARVAEKDSKVIIKRLGAPREMLPASNPDMLPTEEDVLECISSF